MRPCLKLFLKDLRLADFTIITDNASYKIETKYEKASHNQENSNILDKLNQRQGNS